MLSALIRAELSYPAMPCGQLAHQRFVNPGPLVLGMSFLNIQRPQQIGDRTVSRRSEPSSRTALIGEQPNPWDLLQPQDPLSFRRPISYGRITNFHFRDCSGGSPCSKAGFCVCTSNPISIRIKPTFVNASVIVWEATAPVKLPIRYCLSILIQGQRLDTSLRKGGISLTPDFRRDPTYAEQAKQCTNIKL